MCAAQNRQQNLSSFSGNQRGLITNRMNLSQGDERPMASFGHQPPIGQQNRLLMADNQSFGGKTGLNWGNSENAGRQRQNQMEYNNRNELQQNFSRETSRSMGGLEDSNKFEMRRTTDDLSRTPEINQEFQNPCFGLSRGSEKNTLVGPNSSQSFPSKSNEKSQTQAWSRPKFNPFSNQEDSGSNQNMGGWGNEGRKRPGDNMFDDGSSFSSTSFGKPFPSNTSGPSGKFSRSFNRDAPAAQGRAFSDTFSEEGRGHHISSSHQDQQNSGDFLQNTRRAFQGNNPDITNINNTNTMSFKNSQSENNLSEGGHQEFNRAFAGNMSGNDRSMFEQQRNFSENSYHQSGRGNTSDPHESYPRYSDNMSGLVAANINRNNLFRTMQQHNRR